MAVTASADEDTAAAREPLSRSRIAGAAGASLLAGAVTLAIAYEQAYGLDSTDILTAVTLMGVLATAAMLPARRAALAVLALIAVWVVGYAVYSWIPDWIESPIPVQDAVGGAALFSSSYVDQQLAGGLLIAIVLAAGVVFAIVTGRGQPAAAPPAAPAEPRVAAPRRAAIVVIAVAALVIATLLPDLRHLLIDSSRGPLPAGWDNANFIAWDYFQQHGLTPMKDFWYPYGAGWLLSDFPTGPVVRWCWQASLLAAAGWALWRLAGPRPVRIGLCLMAIVTVALFDPIDSPGVTLVWRYVPALVLALCYVAVGPLRHGRPTRGHLVFAAVCAVVAAMEFDIFLAGLAGAAFVAAGELAFDRSLWTWRIVRAALIDAVPVLAGVGITLLFWTLTSSFDQNLSWFTAFRAVSAASGPIQELGGALVGLQPDPDLVTLLATVPALVLAAAFYERRFGGEGATLTSQLLFAAAGCSAIVLAKHLVRPQGAIVLFVPLIALLWAVILQWQARSMRSAIVAGLFAGALLGYMQLAGNVKPTRYLGDALTTPIRAVDDLRLVLDRGTINTAGNGRFAPERLAAIPEKLFIADRLASGLSGTGDSRFAVLGDAQILYVLFGQKPPTHVTLYDAARRSEQRRWIDSVRRLNPKLLIWRRDFNIDGVPYEVRNPLVFAYAIANYVPQEESDPYDVLRKRRPGEPVATAFWRRRLGSTLNLGGIPSYSRGAGLERCSAGRDCVQYAIVTGPGTSTGVPVTVKFARTPYGVQLSTRTGVNRYAVRLDRLWFWRYAGGGSAPLVSGTPGWNVQQTGLRAGDDLY